MAGGAVLGFSHREQIDSHSSMLTNQRIANIEEKAWQLQLRAFANLMTIEPAVDYWACIQAYYTQVQFFFEAQATRGLREEMERRLKAGLKLSADIQLKKNKRSWLLAEEAWQFHVLIRMAGQILGYWTRMSKVEPKGLDEHIRMFDRVSPFEK